MFSINTTIMRHRSLLFKFVIFTTLLTCLSQTILANTWAAPSTFNTLSSITAQATTPDDDDPNKDKNQANRKSSWMIAGGSILIAAGAIGGIVLLGLGSSAVGACVMIGGIVGGTALIAGNNAMANTPPEYSYHTQPPSYVPSHKESAATATDTLSSTTLKEQPDNLLPNPDPERITQYKERYSNACSRARREVSGYLRLAAEITDKQKQSSSSSEVANMKKSLEEKRTRLQNELTNLQNLRQQIYYYGGAGVPDPVEAKLKECLSQPSL